MRKIFIIFGILGILSVTSMANAEQAVSAQEMLPKVSFQVSVDQNVKDDRIRLELNTQIQANKLSSQQSQDLEQRVATVIRQLEKYKGIQVVENRRSSYANYNEKGKIVGWVSQATLALESGDFSQTATFIAALPAEFQISDSYFFVSSEKRKQQEDEMLKALLTKAQQKSELIKTNLHYGQYQIINVNINRDNPEYSSTFKQAPIALRLAKNGDSRQDNEGILSFTPSETRLTLSADITVVLSAK